MSSSVVTGSFLYKLRSLRYCINSGSQIRFKKSCHDSACNSESDMKTATSQMAFTICNVAKSVFSFKVPRKIRISMVL